jgi:DNA-binding transcriptional ArsR family regulator
VYVVSADEPALRRTRIDARALRVLAHPLRTRLLGALRLDGPATATTLARALDTNTGATSYHLRKLAEVGLVEEEPGGSGRERVWRAAHDSHAWTTSDFAGDPDSEAAREWLESEYFQIFLDSARAWAAAAPGWPVRWRDAADSSDAVLDLTPEELAALTEELGAVIQRHQLAGRRARAAGQVTDRRRVMLHLHSFPDVRAGGPPDREADS